MDQSVPRAPLSPLLPFLVALAAALCLAGCAATPAVPMPKETVWQQGRNIVGLVPDPEAPDNTHPARLSATEIGAILRGVRVSEHRNWLHRLIAGTPPKARAFRDDEIELLAPALVNALAEARPDQQVYLHLSQVTEEGEEETTTGRMFLRHGVLHLALAEVHDRHGPQPDISRYDRQMPDVPPAPLPFTLTFEPEDALIDVSSPGPWWALRQGEELHINLGKALETLPKYPLKDSSS